MKAVEIITTILVGYYLEATITWTVWIEVSLIIEFISCRNYQFSNEESEWLNAIVMINTENQWFALCEEKDMKNDKVAE